MYDCMCTFSEIIEKHTKIHILIIQKVMLKKMKDKYSHQNCSFEYQTNNTNDALKYVLFWQINLEKKERWMKLACVFLLWTLSNRYNMVAII